MRQIIFSDVEGRMDHNPFLKPWNGLAPDQVAGKGKIEKPGEVENIVHQTRPAPPTGYENRLGDALQEIFGADIDQLPDVVAQLNDLGVQTESGEDWTEESFQSEMKRLGA